MLFRPVFFRADVFLELLERPREDADFFVAFFFDAPFFGMFAPASRASLSAIAIACFRFFTFFRPPDFNSPCLYSCITFSTFLRPLPRDDELDDLERDELDFLVANPHSS